MRRENLLLVVKQMNEASQLSAHAAEYVVMVAELAFSEGERQGRVDALEEAKKIVEAAA